jgi:hypothetical protein
MAGTRLAPFFPMGRHGRGSDPDAQTTTNSATMQGGYAMVCHARLVGRVRGVSIMKLIAFFSAVALAAGTIVTAAPAEAQRYGYDRGHDRGDHRGYDRGYNRGGPRGYDRGWHRGPDRRGFRGGYNRGRHYGYGNGRGYGRSRVVCRVQRGYYGPVRRCFRVYR